VKFLATDTGRIYIGDGSAWQPLASPAGARTPSIVCYESDGTAYAETPAQTYTGSCIFDAAQQAIDAQVAADNANIDLKITPDTYSLTQGIRINNQGLERVCIGSPGWGVVELLTQNVTDGPVIEIDPQISSYSFSKRNKNVKIHGLLINDRGRSSRPIDAIKVRQIVFLEIKNVRCRNGHRRSLFMDNIWQGKVHTFLVEGGGSTSAGTTAIQIGTPSSTGTTQATNHIQFNHLQGDPTNGFGEGYFRSYAKMTRCQIMYPNVELGDNPGFIFDATDVTSTQHRIHMVGPALSDGSPTIQFNGTMPFSLVGGHIRGDEHAITDGPDSGVNKVDIAGTSFYQGDATDVISLSNCWLNIAGCRIDNGTRGINLSNPSYANITGCTIRNQSQACIKSTNGIGNALTISGVNVKGADSGEHPIYLGGQDNSHVGPVTAQSSRPVEAVRIGGCDNISIGQITAYGSLSGELVDDFGPSTGSRVVKNPL